MFRSPAQTPRLNLVPATGHGGLQRLDQQTQPDGEIPFDVAVGEEVLVHHIFLDGGFSHGDNGSMLRAGLRRIPGGAAASQNHQIGVLEIAFRLAAQIQRVALGEVGVQRRALHHRNGEQFGQGYQVVEPLDFAPRAVRDYQRGLAPGNQVGQFRDVLVGWANFGRGRDGAQFFRRRPRMHHGLDGDVHEGRSLGNPLGQFARPHQLLVHGVRAGGPSAPLGEGVGETVGTAHHAQVAVPLPLGVDLRILAIAGRFAGAHQHRHLADHGAVHAHAALQQADAGVQQYRLHPAGDPGVPAGHIDGQGLVPAVDVLRPGRFVNLLAGQRFPYRRPLRTR